MIHKRHDLTLTDEEMKNIPEPANLLNGMQTILRFAEDSALCDTYFENVHSDLFIWVSVIEENATLYMMNADEFRTFCFKFSGMNERGFVRFKAAL